MIQTKLLILRKTPYRETNLIVSGISPECGRLDLVLRGALTSGKKKFPAAGLFRIIQAEFNEKAEKILHEGTGNLITVYSTELVREFDSIALHTENYMTACKFAPELLAASRPMLAAPEAFQAAQWFFRNLAEGKKAEPALSLACLAVVNELGELPQLSGRSGEFVEKLLSCVRSDSELPADIPESYWKKLTDWRHVVCRKYFS